MNEIVTPGDADPQVGDRVRWHAPSGTYFGRVVSVADDGPLSMVRIEDTDLDVPVLNSRITVLSAPRGGAA